MIARGEFAVSAVLQLLRTASEGVLSTYPADDRIQVG